MLSHPLDVDGDKVNEAFEAAYKEAVPCRLGREYLREEVRRVIKGLAGYECLLRRWTVAVRAQTFRPPNPLDNPDCAV